MLSDVVLGLIAVAVGAVFCFRGYLTLRLVIPVWGGFTGFVLGAAAVSSITGDGFLGTVASWIGGAVLAIVFALVAYLYYEISVLLAMGAIGFALGSSLMVALDISREWIIIGAGVTVGVLLAGVAMLADLPMLLLTVLTAMAGSTAVVVGVMLLVGSVDADEVGASSMTERIQDAPGWWLLYVGVAVAGLIAQLRTLDTIRGSLRQRWEAEGGRQLRGTPTP